MTSVRNFYLYNNQLSGTIPTTLPASIGVLLLFNNQLSGEIPDLSGLSRLSHLYLHKNQLSGEIPDLSGLSRLRNLYLFDNQLSGTIPDLPTSLQELWLHDNQLSGEIPTLPTSLNFLSLYGNTGLYGYPVALNNRSSLHLVAPGDGLAMCLPSTQGGTDCTIPTLVDNLSVETSGSNLVFSWAPNPR